MLEASKALLFPDILAILSHSQLCIQIKCNNQVFKPLASLGIIQIFNFGFICLVLKLV